MRYNLVPLDLRAAEAHLKAALEGDDASGMYVEALLAHCRALRVALDEWLSPLFDERELAERRARSVAILAQAKDQ